VDRIVIMHPDGMAMVPENSSISGQFTVLTGDSDELRNFLRCRLRMCQRVSTDMAFSAYPTHRHRSGYPGSCLNARPHSQDATHTQARTLTEPRLVGDLTIVTVDRHFGAALGFGYLSAEPRAALGRPAP